MKLLIIFNYFLHVDDQTIKLALLRYVQGWLFWT